MPELIRGNLRIEWENIGEGYNGDYDDTNPDDVNLLRFYVSQRDTANCEFEDIDSASYCTLFPANTTDAQQMQALEFMMDKIYPVWISGDSIKRITERLSWISPQNIQTLQV